MMSGTRWPPRSMTSCLLILMCLHMALDFVKGSERLRVAVKTPHKLHKTKLDFVSVAISPHQLVDHAFDFKSKRLTNLMRALAPAYIRIGGIRAEMTIFNPDNPQFLLPETIKEWSQRFQREQFWNVGVMGYWENEVLTNKTWNAFMRMTHRLHWKVQYGLNYALMYNGSYDISYALKFLQYNKKVLGLQVDTVELVNEPNSLGHKWKGRISVSPKVLASETLALKDGMARAGFGNVKISGPDVTSLARSFNAGRYLKEFLLSGGKEAVNDIALHHYNVNGRTVKERDLMNIRIMDTVKLLLTRARQTAASVGARQPIILSETACCYNGGSEAFGDTFVGGFMWLDELGLAAQYGIARVNRQALLGGWYSLLQAKSYDPKPDYYTAVLFKRLVAGAVLGAELLPRDPNFRVYANCARINYYRFPSGSVVLYYLNLKDYSVHLESDLFDNNRLKLYILTGYNEGLKSTHLALNGEKLEMRGHRLPKMRGKKHKGPIHIPAHSYGFIVVTGENKKGWSCTKMVRTLTKGEDVFLTEESTFGERVSGALLSFCVWLGLCDEQ